MIQLKSRLVTAFHRSIATDDWLGSLSRNIVERLRTLALNPDDRWIGVITSVHNSDSKMGPLSLCKYDFRVQLTMGKGLLRHKKGSSYSAHIKFMPETGSFCFSSEIVDTPEKRKLISENIIMVDKLSQIINSDDFSLDQMEKERCLVCGNPIEIDYRQDGKFFNLCCSHDTTHFNKMYRATVLPAWWKQKSGMLRYIR